MTLMEDLGGTSTWQNTPSMKGDFKTGTHSAAANDLALFIQTTRYYHDRTLLFFEAMYRKHERLIGDLTFRQRVDVLDGGGYWLQHDLKLYCNTWYKSVIDSARSKYLQETREFLHFTTDLYTDVSNWVLRWFNNWLNDKLIQSSQAGPEPA